MARGAWPTVVAVAGLVVLLAAAVAAAVALRELDDPSQRDAGDRQELTGYPRIDCTLELYEPAPETVTVPGAEGVSLEPITEVAGATYVVADPQQPLLWVALHHRGVLVIDLDDVPPGGEALDAEDLGDRLVLDLAGEISDGYEQGVIGLAVDPEGEELYVHRTALDDSTVITAHAIEGAEVADEGRPVLEMDQPAPSHNGGGMTFGPDGMLYVALGDGGFSPVDQPDAEDHSLNAQDLSSPLGAILRLDPRAGETTGEVAELGEAVAIPDDNPFVDQDGMGAAIWTTGARNPYSFSFDPATGDLWVADVGQHCAEEINHLPAEDGVDAGRGENLGWPWLEGRYIYEEIPPTGDHVLPVHTYRTGDNGCAVIGGSVYHGEALEDLRGWYVFGDNCTPELRALRVTGENEIELRSAGVSVERLTALGTDADGELIVASMAEGVSRVVPD